MNAATRALPEHLAGRSLVVARVAWVALTLALMTLTTFGFVRAFAQPHLVEMPDLTVLFAQLGLGLRAMMAVALATPLAVALVVCWIVFWRRSRDPMALLFTATILALHAYSSRSLLAFEGVGVLEHAISAVFATAVTLLALTFALFPDGRVFPSWARWLPVGIIVFVVANPDAGAVLMAVTDGRLEVDARSLTLAIGFCALLVLGIVAQSLRYRRASTPAQRHQTKWVLLALGVTFVLFVGLLSVMVAVPAQSRQWAAWLVLAVIPTGIGLPIVLANAVLRYRLYDIDRFVSRTISYGIVVVVLGGAYAGLVVTLRGLLPVEGDLPVAVSTLAVAMLFLPFARRTRRLVDRVFFRSHYDSATVVSLFADELRQTLDPGQLNRRTVDILQRTFQPQHLHVWIDDG